MKNLFWMAFLLLGCSTLNKPMESAKVETPAYVERGVAVEYNDGKTTLKGYVARPETKDMLPRPAVIIVHEWWGHNQYTRQRADMLADLGYVAFAVDMYGDGKTADHPQDAMSFMSEVAQNAELKKQRFDAALKFVQAREDVDKKRIAAIGYCFGGSVVLDMVRSGAPLKVGASFHGGLGTSLKMKKGSVKTKVLVYNGEADPMVNLDSIAAFKKEMKDAKVKFEFSNYKGAKHAFTNPAATEKGVKFNLPLEYNKEADEQSWKSLVDNLAKSL
jgi:dienelactone hydrolase